MLGRIGDARGIQSAVEPHALIYAAKSRSPSVKRYPLLHVTRAVDKPGSGADGNLA